MNKPVTQLPATDLIATAAAHGSFTTLRKALDAAELTHVLQGTGPYTVFAPTDEAFGRLPNGTLENWLKPQNKAELLSVLKYHVLRGYASSADIGTMTHPRMLQGHSADIKKEGEQISIDGAHLVGVDIPSSNGVIHAIDAVIQPPKLASRH
ncbi:fasciclin domain-containing protein [Frateuria defendens]|uniref:fasciclin domain-containing protein n=1 Tax=Frateuria defendens TaxID=2219559 RepID=UPI00066FECA1|nr:fasciclin domain-containing protein [Frateuria defendens]